MIHSGGGGYRSALSCTRPGKQTSSTETASQDAETASRRMDLRAGAQSFSSTSQEPGRAPPLASSSPTEVALLRRPCSPAPGPPAVLIKPLQPFNSRCCLETIKTSHNFNHRRRSEPCGPAETLRSFQTGSTCAQHSEGQTSFQLFGRATGLKTVSGGTTACTWRWFL